LPDFLRGRIAPRGRGLEVPNRGAAPLVEGDQAARLWLKPPARKAVIEGVGVFADEANIVHGVILIRESRGAPP
jgi:hypothetical protein